MYCPWELMVPGPLFPSPPLTDQVTAALPPEASVAVNCSTDAPEALVALQPEQLVSTAPVPGAMENVLFDGLAVTPPPKPANRSNAGTAAIASNREAKFHARAARKRSFAPLKLRICRAFAPCAVCGKTYGAFLSIFKRSR